MPDWVKDQLIPQSLSDNYQTLHDLLQSIDVAETAKLSPLEAIALRFITIHFWRRLALRHPLLPQGLSNSSWVGCKAHAQVKALYANIIDTSEKWWETPTTEKGLKHLQQRFQ